MFVLMLISALIIPVLLAVFGLCLFTNPPKKISDTVGYRTKLSCKNTEIWLFAQNYAGKLWFVLGIIMLVISAPVMFLFKAEDDGTICIVTAVVFVVQTVFFLISNAMIAKKLKQNFDENGNRL